MPIYREYPEIAFVLNNVMHKFAGDVVRTRRETVNKRSVAEDVDHTRDARTGLCDQVAPLLRKQMLASAHRTDTETDVLKDLRRGQRLEVEVGRDSLRGLQPMAAGKTYFS